MFEPFSSERGRLLHKVLVVAACTSVLSLVQCGGSSSSGNPAAGGSAQGGNDTGGTASDGGSSGTGGSGTGGSGTSGAGGSSGSGGASSGGSSGVGGSGTGGGGPDGGTPPDLSDLPGKLAQAACDAVVQCYGTAITSYLFGDKCVDLATASSANGTLLLLADAIARGTVLDTPERVDPCLAALRTDCRLIESDSFCDDVYPGRIKAGEACSFSAECEKGLYCNWGMTCPGTCEARLPLNATCRWSTDCEIQLRCDGDSKVCVPDETLTRTGASGDGCDPTTTTLCQDGLACAGTSVSGGVGVFTCETPPTSFCHIAIPEECPTGQFCALTSGLVGACVPVPKAGEPCGRVNPARPGTRCERGSVCNATTGNCVAVAVNGASCTANDQCHSQNCHNGTCMVPKCTP